MSRFNVRFAVVSLALCAVCCLVVHLVHGFAVESNTSHLLDLANKAEEEGRRDDAIQLLAQYLNLQSSREVSDEDADQWSELTDQYVRLGEWLDEPQASEDRLLRVYRTFEEVLRRDPERAAVRRRLVDLSMQFGRFGTALNHADKLIENTDTDDTATLAELRLRQGACNFALGNHQAAQQQYLEAISDSRSDAGPYLGLARFWLTFPSHLVECGDWFGHERFDFLRPALSELDHGGAQAEKSAFALLGIMVEQVQPSVEAHLRRAQFLAEIRLEDESLPQPAEAAVIAAQHVLAVASEDEDNNSILQANELWHSQVPPLADLDEDGQVTEEELVGRYMAGDALTRLRIAERSVTVALDRIPQEDEVDDSDSLLSEALLAAAEVSLRLAEASQLEEFDAKRIDEIANRRRENQDRYLAEANRLAQQGRELDQSDGRFYLTSARLEMQRAGESTDVAGKIEHFQAAETLLKDGLDRLEGADGATDEQDNTLASAGTASLRLDLQWILTDLLFAKSSLQEPPEAQRTRDEATELLRALEEQREQVPQEMLAFLAAREEIVSRNWRVARERLLSVYNSAAEGSDLRRRAILMLAFCHDQLNNPDAKLDLYRVALNSDPLWRDGLVGEADALADLGRIDEAITKYQRLVSIPGVKEKLAGLLLLQQLPLPAERRDWSGIERILDAAYREAPDSQLVATLRVDVLWQRAATLWRQASAADDESATSATALLEEAETLLRAHRDSHTEDPSAWSALAIFASRRFDKASAARVARAEQVLSEAVVELGDSPELRLAAIQVVATQPDDRAVELLEGSTDDIDEFSEEDRYRIRAVIAQTYASAGALDLALESWEQAAELQPENLTPRLAILEMLFDQLSAGNAADQERNMDLWQRYLTEAEEIEGSGGPLSTVYRAQRMIADAVSNKELQTDRERLVLELDGARQILQEAEQQRPYWSAIPRMRGSIEAVLGNRELTISHFERAIELGDRSASVIATVMQHYHRLSFMAMDRAEGERAREKATRLYELVNQQSPAVFTGALGRLAGQVLRYNNQGERAIALQQRVSESSNDPQDKMLLAAMQFEAVRTNPLAELDEQEPELEAMEYLLNDAIQLDPQSPDSRLALVEFYVRLARTDDAEQAIQDAVDNLPDEPPHLVPFTAAQCYEVLAVTRGLPAEQADDYRNLAEQHFRHALDAEPGHLPVKYATAAFFARAGRPDEAIELLDQLLAPGLELSEEARTQALITKALTIESRGSRTDTQQALELLEAVEAPDDSWQARIRRTQASIIGRRNAAGDAAALVELFEQIAGLESLYPRERFQLATLYDENEIDWSTARRMYEDLIREYPNDTAVRARLVAALLRRSDEGDNLTDARTYFDELRTIEPDSFRTHMIGVRLAAEGDGTEAGRRQAQEAARRLAEFVRNQTVSRPVSEFVDQVEPEGLSELVQHLAEVARNQGDEGALDGLDRVEQLLRSGDTESATDALRALGAAQWAAAEMRVELIRRAALLLEVLGHTDLAGDLYQEYVDASQRPRAILAVAQYLARRGRHLEALALCEQHWNEIPVQTVADTAVGVILHGRLGDAEVARIAPRLEQALGDADETAEQIALLLLLADIRLYQQRYDEVQSTYFQILQLQPDQVIALNNLAWLSARLGQPVPAGELIHRAIEAAGNFPDLLDTLGVVQMAGGRTQRAVETLTLATEKDPTAARIFVHLAEAHWRANNHAAARQALAKSEELEFDRDSLHPLERAEYDRMTQAIGEQ